MTKITMHDLHATLEDATESMTPTQFLNVVVEFLAQDKWWFKTNISEVDLNTIRNLVNTTYKLSKLLNNSLTPTSN